MIIIYLETNSIMAIAKGRNKELANSDSFVNYLELCLIDYGKLLRDFRKRFLKILEYLKNHGELIEPRIEMLVNTLNSPLIPGKNQKRDDFILRVILAHAENNLSMSKVFFSENTKDFGNTNIQQVLANVGINYFSKVSNLQGWLKEQ